MTPYTRGSCTAASMGGDPLFSAPLNSGRSAGHQCGLRVVTSYLRSQPTRILYPTEILRLQSSSIRNVAMNGDIRYTNANMNMPNYYENFQGLNKAAGANGGARSMTYTGNASAKREVVAADYGIVWQATKTFSLADQMDFSNVAPAGHRHYHQRDHAAHARYRRESRPSTTRGR